MQNAAACMIPAAVTNAAAPAFQYRNVAHRRGVQLPSPLSLGVQRSTKHKSTPVEKNAPAAHQMTIDYDDSVGQLIGDMDMDKIIDKHGCKKAGAHSTNVKYTVEGDATPGKELHVGAAYAFVAEPHCGNDMDDVFDNEVDISAEMDEIETRKESDLVEKKSDRSGKKKSGTGKKSSRSAKKITCYGFKCFLRVFFELSYF